MTAAHILSSTATIHAARAYTPPGKTVADLIQLHNERRDRAEAAKINDRAAGDAK